jgi:hypothetical protein
MKDSVFLNSKTYVLIMTDEQKNHEIFRLREYCESMEAAIGRVREIVEPLVSCTMFVDGANAEWHMKIFDARKDLARQVIDALDSKQTQQ